MAKQVKNQAKQVAQPKAKVISLLVKDNPKRGNSRERFAIYRTGMSPDQYVAKCVAAGNAASLARADLRWDLSRKFIAIR